MAQHPDDCNGSHEPVWNEINPRGRCANCGSTETEIWAMGEQLYAHMHVYEEDEHGLMRCSKDGCLAWLTKRWHEDKLTEGRRAREARVHQWEKSHVDTG